MTARILVVEDERAQREALCRYAVTGVDRGEAALSALRDESPSLMITDLRLPGIDGLEVVRRARELDDRLCVLLITAFASVDSAIEALRIGADDYLLKPLVLEEVARKVATLLNSRALVEENARLRTAVRMVQKPDRPLVAVSDGMQDVMRWVQRVASKRTTVLITGETGCGKEVVARAIHDQSPHANEPFLPINLAALPRDMAESELFGHERGAFTGAASRREGVLRAAGRGTVFLDEIAELELGLQAKLLRALEAHEVSPLGSDQVVPYQARIVAATHRNLRLLVERGDFREDLYYRLAVLEIEVPPLRDRPDDIPPLVRHLLNRHGSAAVGIEPEAMRALCRHPWRGNVRELSNVLQRALVIADGDRIDLDHLPNDVCGSAGDDLKLADAVSRFERGHIALVLRLCDGNREQAAEQLGISEATLYRRLGKLGLNVANSQN